MKIPSLMRKAGAFLIVSLAVFYAAQPAAEASTAEDWFTQLYDAYEGLAGDQPEAAAATTPEPATVPTGSSSANPSDARVENRVMTTGTVLTIDGFEFIASSSEGYAVITKYVGTAGDLIVPATLNGYPVEYIGDGAFSYCYSLTTLKLPDTVVGLGNSAFFGCMNLKEITLPAGIVNTGASLFLYCQSLQRVDLPPELTTVKFGLFEQCQSLQTIIIPDKVTSIEELAFHNCVNLKEVTIPRSVLNIAEDAFSSCPQATLRAFEGSFAQQYATQKGIPCTIIQ